jgi:hypothetical protein
MSRVALPVALFTSPQFQPPEMFSQGVAHQSGPVSPAALRGLVGGSQQLLIQHDLHDLHMWNSFHSILHTRPISKAHPDLGSGAVRPPHRACHQYHAVIPSGAVFQAQRRISRTAAAARKPSRSCHRQGIPEPRLPHLPRFSEGGNHSPRKSDFGFTGRSVFAASAAILSPRMPGCRSTAFPQK